MSGVVSLFTASLTTIQTVVSNARTLSRLAHDRFRHSRIALCDAPCIWYAANAVKLHCYTHVDSVSETPEELHAEIMQVMPAGPRFERPRHRRGGIVLPSQEIEVSTRRKYTTDINTNPKSSSSSQPITSLSNIYYGTLYAYTPEVLPSAHRGTGNGIAIACNRIMGIMSALVGL
ncbi:uncharacterized protein K489DRAFT_371270 [Dissoconium aciculare CBS 342.82]|uniref:Uncharacterized protein n=1 Tax=Dissoconium aciculare CBS 342.82 TaxID=1314786 RepID=A0A6J3M6D0_9PEZI|nr:uncharacterized protein K489DRAFT_371270 [Dissoconium aciculare CBS 342.82]KAF1822432.1 hypothetical protein K489DRAFT_371270 [Dissoconium aciculare CBS 342.82]